MSAAAGDGATDGAEVRALDAAAGDSRRSAVSAEGLYCAALDGQRAADKADCAGDASVFATVPDSQAAGRRIIADRELVDRMAVQVEGDGAAAGDRTGVLADGDRLQQAERAARVFQLVEARLKRRNVARLAAGRSDPRHVVFARQHLAAEGTLAVHGLLIQVTAGAAVDIEGTIAADVAEQDTAYDPVSGRIFRIDPIERHARAVCQQVADGDVLIRADCR